MDQGAVTRALMVKRIPSTFIENVADPGNCGEVCPVWAGVCGNSIGYSRPESHEEACAHVAPCESFSRCGPGSPGLFSQRVA